MEPCVAPRTNEAFLEARVSRARRLLARPSLRPSRVHQDRRFCYSDRLLRTAAALRGSAGTRWLSSRRTYTVSSISRCESGSLVGCGAYGTPTRRATPHRPSARVEDCCSASLQKGHRGSYRELLPSARVNQFVDLFPEACLGCARDLPRIGARSRYPK